MSKPKSKRNPKKKPVYKARFEVEIELAGTDFDLTKDLTVTTRHLASELHGVIDEKTRRRLRFVVERILHSQSLNHAVIDLVIASIVTLFSGSGYAETRRRIIEDLLALRKKRLRGELLRSTPRDRLLYTESEVYDIVSLHDELIEAICRVKKKLKPGQRVTKTAVARSLLPPGSAHSDTNPCRDINRELKQLGMTWESLVEKATKNLGPEKV